MLEPSPRLKKEASQLGCEPNHIIMADLILSGYTEAEAFDIAYSEFIASSVKRKIAQREAVLASEGYKRAYDNRFMTRRNVSEHVEMRDKTDVERDLNSLINSTRDQKMKAELLMKLADLKQMKKDISADEEDPVRFFFPISCEKCPLLIGYNKTIAQKNAELPREEWNLEVRPDEMQRLMEQAAMEIERMRIKEKESVATP